jgi:hypothetical protein
MKLLRPRQNGPRARRQSTHLGLESLEDRLVPSWGSTPPSSLTVPSSASAIVLDSSGDASGTASISANEIDWYKFTATTAGTYIFTATTPSSNLDTVIGIYSSAGARKAYNDDLSSSNTDSRVSVSLTAGQTYAFGVTNYTRTSGGAYTWAIDGPAAVSPPPVSPPPVSPPPVSPPPTTTDDSYEENDTQATAYNLGTLTAAQTITGLKMADAADWYKFTISSTGTSSNSVSIAFTHSQGDLDLKLYNASGTQIGISQGTTNSESISLSGLAAGTYYVQAYGYQGALNPSYSLTINPPAAASPPVSPPPVSPPPVSPPPVSPPPVSPPPVSPPPAANAWTVFVYVTSSSLYDYAFADINEMEKAVSTLPSNVKVVALWDQSAANTKYATGNGTQAAWGTTGRAIISGDTNMSRVATTFEIMPEQDTGNPTTLSSFLTWGAGVAPASHYSLILWNHGAGIYGSNFDDSDNTTSDYLSLTETASALGTTGVPHISVFSYDACMMGMMEVGDALKNQVDVFAASEELEDGPGHDYTTLFNVLKTNPQNVTAEQLGAGYVTSFGNQYVGTGTTSDTYSAIRSTGYAGLEAALKAFSDSTIGASSTVRSALGTARNGAVQYDGSTDYPDFRDLGSFMRNVANNTSIPSNIRTAANNVIAAITPALISKTNDSRGSSGIAIYIPQSTYDTTYAAMYPAFTAATGWDSFTKWLVTGSRTVTTTSVTSGGRVHGATRGGTEEPLAFGNPETPTIRWSHETGSSAGSDSHDHRHTARHETPPAQEEAASNELATTADSDSDEPLTMGIWVDDLNA